jgi:hypothetical protein
MPEDDPLLTREQIIDRARDVHGVPITYSYVAKLCRADCYRGPEVAGWLGQRPLSHQSVVDAWIRALVSPTPPVRRAGPGRPKRIADANSALPTPMPTIPARRPRGRPRKESFPITTA